MVGEGAKRATTATKASRRTLVIFYGQVGVRMRASETE